MNYSLSDIADKYNLRKVSNKWAGPCPRCGGTKGSDKFNLFEDGGFKCYGCDFRGDAITWLREMEGLSCPAAHESAGRECRSTNCEVYGTCRMGDGSGKGGGKRVRKISSAKPLPEKHGPGLPVIQSKSPKDLWLTWGLGLVDKAAAALLLKSSVLDWLAKRGIDLQAVKRYRLGWLDHDRKVNRAAIGLSAARSGKQTLWVPGGLLIPVFDEFGGLHRLRVRRTKDSLENFLPNLKYVWIEGSGNDPQVIRAQGAERIRGAVIVEAELDGMAVAANHGEIIAVAIGSVQAGVQENLRKELQQQPTILVALDAEPGKDGKPGPGPEAAKIWQQNYRQAKFWPVLEGKDPGEYAVDGGDLRLWIESGLLPAVPQDLPLVPGRCPEGGRGKENNTSMSPPPEEMSIAGDMLEIEPGLRKCSLCLGDRFLAAEAGGYFCLVCQPSSRPGRMVKAAISRGHYVVR